MKKTLLTTLILLAFALGGVAQTGSFAPQGAEWYFDVLNPWGMHHNYALFSVDGDTIIQGHHCSVIRQNFVETGPGHENGEFVYEENNKVYWFNPTTNTFTTLYDFAAEAGDSWYYEVGSCSHLVTVDSVGSVTWDGRTYRTQWVKYHDYQNLPAFRGRIIEGIGYEKGLFPSVWTCNGEILYDASEIEYLRCYVENGEMVYHEGSYDCDYDEYTNCWDGTVAEAYEGGDGTEENPYQIATSQQLALLAQQTNNGSGGDAYYKLTSDINLGSCAGPYWQWVSIGTVARPFTGHFNGDGNTILNMNQDISDGDSQPVGGLFGCTNDAEISNVNLMRCYVSGNGKYVGILVGYAGLTNIYSCSIYDGRASTNNANGRAGGLVGFAGYTYGEQGTSEQPYSIMACQVKEAVKVESALIAGGVVGQVNDVHMRAPYVIVGCWMLGRAEGFYVQGGSATGGVVGSMWYGTMEGCSNNQKVVGGRYNGGGCVGGLVGMCNYGDISLCLNNETGQVSCPDTAYNVHVGGIAGFLGSGNVVGCSNNANVDGLGCCGGIVGIYMFRESNDSTYFVQNNHNLGMVTCKAHEYAGGIVGFVGVTSGNLYIVECNNYGDVVIENEYQGNAGGILGSTNSNRTFIMNVFNRGLVRAPKYAGGILGGDGDHRHCTIQNVYNTGVVITEEETKGAIAFEQGETDHFSDCYWLGLLDNHAGVSEGEPLQHSCAFWPTTYYGEWSLDSLQFGHDLVEALNTGAEALVEQYPAVLTLIHRWEYDIDHINDGYPVFSGIEIGYPFGGTEWYYEIENENGTITYQHLEYAADTTINDKTVVIIIRTNTLYDKGEHTEVTREYVYEENGVIYWWNKDLQEFTTLYDFGAEAGDEWEIKVGMESITMHVDSVKYYEYDGELYKMLMVSDENDVFSGNIVCGIGHQTSFFPERLMTRGKDYRVEGIRCVWRNGELVFKYGNKDCDEVYQVYHNGLNESAENQFNIYPNPTNGVLVVETRRATSLQNQTYRITNLMGQILMSGNITAETQQVDVSNLPHGMYFISIGEGTRKFVVR